MGGSSSSADVKWQQHEADEGLLALRQRVRTESLAQKVFFQEAVSLSESIHDAGCDAGCRLKRAGSLLAGPL